MPDEQIIKLRAHELCINITANKYTVQDRNRRIISILMEEFGIDEDYATECFLHNNEI